jgi:hypothetical protein
MTKKIVQIKRLYKLESFYFIYILVHISYIMLTNVYFSTSLLFCIDLLLLCN